MRETDELIESIQDTLRTEFGAASILEVLIQQKKKIEALERDVIHLHERLTDVENNPALTFAGPGD